MSTTYKIYSAAATDGAAYIDLPISGKIEQVNFCGNMVASAGGVGTWDPELSRVAINQVAINNPRGVIAMASLASETANTGIQFDHAVFPNEPVKSGERLYLNCAAATNFGSGKVACFVTIA